MGRCLVHLGIAIFALALMAFDIGCGGATTPKPPTTSGSAAPSSDFIGMTSQNASAWFNNNAGMGITEIRLWDTGTAWGDIQTGPTTYNWTTLDEFVSAAYANNTKLLYTFGKVPLFANGNSTDASCGYYSGSCTPPTDIDTTNQYYKNFVTALVNRYGNKIAAYEMWNEPYTGETWKGTAAQLKRLVADGYAIIKAANPNTIITTPTFAAETAGYRTWVKNYLDTGGGAYADVISFHFYGHRVPQACTTPPDFDASLINGAFDRVKALTDAKGLYKPIWHTEGSWGSSSKMCLDSHYYDSEAGFIAQWYLYMLSKGVKRSYWYAWNNGDFGTLWTSSDGVRLPAIALANLKTWLQGKTLVAPCKVRGTVWTCDFKDTGGYQQRAIWDTSQSCEAGSCTTVDVVVDATYTHYYDLSTNTSHTVTNNTVPVGYKPIWLESDRSN